MPEKEETAKKVIKKKTQAKTHTKKHKTTAKAHRKKEKPTSKVLENAETVKSAQPLPETKIPVTSTLPTGRTPGDFLSLNNKLILVAVVGIALLFFFTFKLDTFSLFDGQEDVILTVNGIEITEEQMQEELNKLPEYYLTGGVDEETLRTAILDQLIAKELVGEQAELLGITVTEEEIEGIIAEMLAEGGLTEEDLQARLEEQGLTEEALYNLLEEQIAINKVVEQEVLANIQITEEEITSYFEEFSDALLQIEASHILICYEGATRCEETRTQEEAFAIAVDLIEQIKAGADFGELAATESDDPSAEFNGGSLGWFGKGQMVPEFEVAAFALSAGEMGGEPVESSFGYHIIYVTDTKTTLEDVQDDIIQTLTLEEQQNALEGYIASLMESAEILWKG